MKQPYTRINKTASGRNEAHSNKETTQQRGAIQLGRLTTRWDGRHREKRGGEEEQEQVLQGVVKAQGVVRDSNQPVA
jgi:hypothetical protein